MEKNGIFNAASSFNKLWNKKYYRRKPRFNGVFSRNGLSKKKIKDGAYVIKLDEFADVGTHWTALFCNKSEIV